MRANADRQARWPDTIIATSTHDNKRSEDVRCRIDVLSEMPGVWRTSRRSMAQPPRGHAHGGRCRQPAPADEYLLYQILLGTLPAAGLDEDDLAAYRERIGAYMRQGGARGQGTVELDATRRGVRSRPRQRSCRRVLARVRPNPLLTDLQALATEVAWFGALNSLSMVLLKYTVPGVPDLYQGNELLDLSLVDPDNRRPVDYPARERALDDLEEAAKSPRMSAHLRDAAPTWLLDGRLKLWLTWRLLDLRRSMPAFFRQAEYLPLSASGARAKHVVAFARTVGDSTLIVVAGRLFSQLLEREARLPIGAAWQDTAVDVPQKEGRTAENILTGEIHSLESGALRLCDLFAILPVAALLIRR